MTADSDATVDLADVRRDVEAMAASQRALTEHLLGLDPADPATPSRLPGWTIGHVLTHIARNADSVLRMVDGLAQYWKGPESRNADIGLGAGRSWSELIADVAETSAAVESRLNEVADWSGTIATTTSVRPKATLPVLRRREVEIHRADLGLGYGFADMPGDYVRNDVRLLTMLWTSRQPMGMTALPDGVLTLTEHDRLAWLMGRIELDGVEPARVY